MSPEALEVYDLKRFYHQEIQPSWHEGALPEQRRTKGDGDKRQGKDEKTPDGNHPTQDDRFQDKIVTRRSSILLITVQEAKNSDSNAGQTAYGVQEVVYLYRRCKWGQSDKCTEKDKIRESFSVSKCSLPKRFLQRVVADEIHLFLSGELRPTRFPHNNVLCSISHSEHRCDSLACQPSMRTKQERARPPI